ncbi:MAG: HAD family hydrolase [Clostridia bacterium]|nr:HAD family hydrolase [Clostridia bacterium]
MEELDSYKLLFVDVDGTMVNSQKEILDSTKHTFEKLKEIGVEVVITSGRQRSNCKKIADLVGLGRYIISANGADVYDRVEQKKIYGEHIDLESLNKLKDLIEKFDLRARMIFEDIAYVNKEIYNPLDEVLMEEDIETFIQNHKIPQIVLYMKDLETFDKVKLEIHKIPQLKICHQTKHLENQKRYFLDITLKTTSKGNAIKKLCKILDIPTLYTVAIGDDNNDISMFEAVGVSIAMGNASKNCMEKASTITSSNDEDGIYHACINMFDIPEFEKEN